MGYVKVKVRNPQERNREAELELLADTGAVYSVIPYRILNILRIARNGTRKMRDAVGSVVERYVGIAEIEISGETAHSNVVFGKHGDTPVLGVAALQELGLQVDPDTGKLKPMELHLSG